MEPNYYEKADKIASRWSDFYHKLKDDSVLSRSLKDWCGNNYTEDVELSQLMEADLILCYLRMGHDAYGKIDSREVYPLMQAVGLRIYRKESLVNEKWEYIERVVKKIVSCRADSELVNSKLHSDTIHLVDFFAHYGLNELKTEYLSILFDFSAVIASADAFYSEQETAWSFSLCLSLTKSEQTLPKNREADEVSVIADDAEAEQTELTPIEELNSLIGLSKVKTEVENLNNLIKVQQLRISRGLKNTPLSYHCVFTGNPGTGKTTVARLLAKIFKDLGVLNSGHLIETDRSGLVADYVGQTATKTNAIIDKALDGVLFIDEAYALAQGGDNDYGKEAIATLLKRMEDNRDRLIVILAGYSKEMEEFINANSGLQSRFNRYIHFPDYTEDELLAIFKLILRSNDYKASEDAMHEVKNVIGNAVANKNEKFGNGRFVRNIFESAITRQASRIVKKSSISDEELCTIEQSDVLFEEK